MGGGFLEDVYQECLELELVERGIPFTSQPRLTLHYNEKPLRKQYTADLIVIEEIVVEIKAARSLAPEHDAQLSNYLKATRKRVGYLVNFGAFPRLEWKRLVR
jgi:GxxExxY protein